MIKSSGTVAEPSDTMACTAYLLPMGLPVVFTVSRPAELRLLTTEGTAGDKPLCAVVANENDNGSFSGSVAFNCTVAAANPVCTYKIGGVLVTGDELDGLDKVTSVEALMSSSFCPSNNVEIRQQLFMNAVTSAVVLYVLVNVAVPTIQSSDVFSEVTVSNKGMVEPSP